jgi:hypothetical chaperone protein
MPKKPSPSLYAIDFGTSNSLLAAVGPDLPPEALVIDPSAKDPTVFRSILFFSEQSEWSFGAEALRRYVEEGMRGRFLRSLKRFLPMASFEETRLGSRNVRLEELVGIYLREMRRRANAHFAADVRRVLLGRPARFATDPAADALAEQRLLAAARFAGFEEVYFCPEPVAAAYDFQSRLEQPKLVLVADFGGGTSDFTVARVGVAGGVVDVLSMGGVSVAGDMLDGAIMRHKVSRHFGSEVTYRVPFGQNVLKMPRPLMEALCSPADTCLLARRDVMTFLRDVQSGSLGPHDKARVDQLVVLIEDALGFQIFESIEQAKRDLSSSEGTLFRFDYPSIEIEEVVTRREFASFSEGAVTAIFQSLDETMQKAGVTGSQVDLVCCTGGTARVATIASGVLDRFGAEKIVRLRSLHSVISGLAARARAYV